jgi:hypothetical protein
MQTRHDSFTFPSNITISTTSISQQTTHFSIPQRDTHKMKNDTIDEKYIKTLRISSNESEQESMSRMLFLIVIRTPDKNKRHNVE